MSLDKYEYKIYWFDPGVTTGYATGLLHDGRLGVISGQAKWNEKEIYQELVRGKPAIVGYESFLYRNNRHRAGVADNVNLFPRNLIGVINLYCQLNGVRLYEQTPSTGGAGGKVGASYYSDQQLKNLGLYKPAHPHANDGLRHLLRWFTFGSGYQYNNGEKDSIYLLA